MGSRRRSASVWMTAVTIFEIRAILVQVEQERSHEAREPAWLSR